MLVPVVSAAIEARQGIILSKSALCTGLIEPCFDAFSSREPVPTSLENALEAPDNAGFWPHPCPAAAPIRVRNGVNARLAVLGGLFQMKRLLRLACAIVA